MGALEGPRGTPERAGDRRFDVVKNDEVIYRGAAVCIDSSGEAVNATATTGLKTRGVCQFDVDNSDDGELVETKVGTFQFHNKSGDEVTAVEVGSYCYWSDNQTVCKTGTGKSVAGLVVSVDNSGAMVTVKLDPDPAAAGLLVANNLSDVNSASTSRANIGANVMDIALVSAASTKASDSTIVRYVAPRAGTLTKFQSALNGALATADATWQLKINGSNVTSGLITQTQSGSAAGDVDSATPSAANTFVAGDVISAVLGGGSTATATCALSISFTY